MPDGSRDKLFGNPRSNIETIGFAQRNLFYGIHEHYYSQKKRRNSTHPYI